MALVCEYEVVYVPPGCTTYKVGQVVEGPCDRDWCSDIVLAGGACDGTYLMTLSCQWVDEIEW
jgi:hypothetical protein